MTTVLSEPAPRSLTSGLSWTEDDKDSPRKGRAQLQASGAARFGPQLLGHRGTEKL